MTGPVFLRYIFFYLFQPFGGGVVADCDNSGDVCWTDKDGVRMVFESGFGVRGV